MESLKPTWKSVVYETLRILPHATPSGRLDLHDQLLAIGHRADRFVQLRSLLVRELETVRPVLKSDLFPEVITSNSADDACFFREENGVAYRAVWVPVGGVICNTLTPIGGEE
tara:strand:- start:6601 stop:6939 length:339 start_codon:yes stop_codon:yes gene_type:complete